MEGFLTGLLENSSFPVVTALVLGLMTAISPCPLATNITAVGFIGKDIENRNRVFYNGLIYTLGRAIAYTLLAFVIFLGADQFEVSGVFQRYGMKIIGLLLIVIGLFMLGVLKISLPGGGKIAERFEKKGVTGYWDVLLLGMLFAMTFCPYSGVLYFGMLIPLTISSASGLYLPIVFAIATGIPVILFAWLIAYAVSGVGGLYQRLKTFEYWFRKVIAVLFILVGLYYIITVFF
ncbi:MAG: aromatic aminobenezylarsenical efflux permease ArsG family transporter [Draconibacterium sp.]